MLRTIILHGARGGPDTNWFPWLGAELVRHDIDVVRPRFPTPEGQSLTSWLAVHDAMVADLVPMPTILVGHSLGAAMALRLAERAAQPYAGLLLAAGFVGALGLPDYDTINATFFAAPLDWTTINRNKGDACRCWAGDEDPYVPLERTRVFAERLDAPLEIIPQGGHLNAQFGFDRFPAVLDAILKLA